LQPESAAELITTSQDSAIAMSDYFMQKMQNPFLAGALLGLLLTSPALTADDAAS